MKKILFVLLILGLSFTSCSEPDSDDNQINVVVDTTPTVNPTPTVDNSEINDYIWKGLNQWYYWQEQVDNLADTFDDNQSDYTTYLQSYSDPENFFNSLNHSDDRFSWIDPDYENLEDQLSGISASNGMMFTLYRRLFWL